MKLRLPEKTRKGQITSKELKSIDYINEKGELRDSSPVESISGIGLAKGHYLRSKGIKTVGDFKGTLALEGVKVDEFKAIFVKPTKPVSKVDKKRLDKNAKKLRDSADALTVKIDEKKNPATRSQNWTPRRAGIMSSMLADAEHLEEIQSIMYSIADKIESDSLPESLHEIDTKTEIETLNSYDSFPKVVLHRSMIRDLKEQASNNREKELVSIVEDAQEDQDRFYTLNPEEIESLTQLVRGYEKRYKIKQKQLKEDREKLRAMDFRSAKYSDLSRRIDLEERDNKELKSSYDGEPKRRISPYNRLARIGITNEKQFREIKKDFMDIKLPPKVKTEDELKQEQIKELEDKVRRYKIAGFFPTPKPVANKVYNYANIYPEHSILEPSAGNGWLADAIAERSGRKPSQIDVVEYNYDLRQILALKGYHVVGNDFLEFDKQKYDRIVMNPPFEKDQDITHVKHAYSLLKPNGRVVAIMSSGVKFRSTGKAPEFRQWVDERGGTIEDLPEGSFKSSFITTGVNTVIVTIDKPEVQEIESIRGVTEKQIINYIPEESVEKMGREWWVKTIQGNTFPNPFKTKKAAIEQAKRHKDLWEDTFDDPERWVRVEEIKYR